MEKVRYYIPYYILLVPSNIYMLSIEKVLNKSMTVDPYLSLDRKKLEKLRGKKTGLLNWLAENFD